MNSRAEERNTYAQQRSIDQIRSNPFSSIVEYLSDRINIQRKHTRSQAEK
jgi:hypothetical protein